ncbi:hypothetical protein F511_30528 [Dorcoceras hygrometricum]|uniref:Uncharacterized protein n=1 Tax=Dorcoceras hygrometricum TaxID=472368 RepID=A0A2Z7AJ40_9LAMI|nr:hypothetical protein F511_30528 [Dorcoceras hygrometricum]
MVSMKNPLAAILDSNKFIGLNYQDWLRNLNLVLASEKLLYAIEKTAPKFAPADISPEELVTLKQWWDDEVKARCYVTASMSNEMQRRFEKTKISCLRHSLHSTMASAFITHSYQINFESVLMIHDHEGMLNMFKALEASGLRRFLGCESVLYEKELGHFFNTALIQGEDVTGIISGKFVSISPTLFAKVFDLPTEGITNFSEVPKDTLYDVRSFFSKEGVQIDVHGKKKYMKHEFRLLNDILAKSLTVKAGSFDSVTVERFQMMTAIHYGLKRIHDSNCEILSKVNAVELGVRGDLLKVQVLLRQSFTTACRVLERQGTSQTTQITDLKKGLMAPVGTIFQDLFYIKKKQREQDAKLITMDEQIAAIRSGNLDFQSKIAAYILSLSTQVGDIADYLRGGAAKKGEIGSSSRPSTVRTQTQTFPPTTGTFEERVGQARRHIIEIGQVISIEEAAERVIEADRRESDRLERERERERRERRQSRSGNYKRRRGY